MALTDPLQKRRYSAVLAAVPVGPKNAATYSDIAESLQAAGVDMRQTSVPIFIGRAEKEGAVQLAPAGDRVHRWYRPECEYKFGCEKAAVTTIDAPAIRDRFPNGVPACESCVAFVEAIK